MGWAFHFLLAMSIVYFNSEFVECLECWFCIGDDCDMSPSKNHRAKIKICQQGQSCQKVEYIGKDYLSNRVYHSVVRSCSQDDCRNKQDNCSEALLTNPGCTDRLCCNKHLCNSAGSQYLMGTTLSMMALTLIVISIIK